MKSQFPVSAPTSDSFNLRLRFEEAPAPGGGQMPAEQERIFVILAHLFPIIIWPWKRKASPLVAAHGREALNFAITMVIAAFAISFVLGFVCALILGAQVAAVLTSAFSGLIGIFCFVFVILAIMGAQQGKLPRYPFTWRFIR
ncbi:MAG: DUF4870 domain-containing protein [Verrucomicrobiaceae bacterium]|nr:DUF4870 domain-containing protein [Verrucomicrobiaceae bacterium]